MSESENNSSTNTGTTVAPEVLPQEKPALSDPEPGPNSNKELYPPPPNDAPSGPSDSSRVHSSSAPPETSPPSSEGRPPAPSSSAPSKNPNTSRLFLGNLVTEATSKEELSQIFAKYGKVLEVRLHRSFGFIQFDTPSAVAEAIKGEQGLVIGGKTVDPSPATGGGGNRDRGRDNHHRYDDRRGRDNRGGYGRDRSPGRDRDWDRRDRRYGGGGGGGGGGYGREPRFDDRGPPSSGYRRGQLPPSPKDGYVVKVLLLGGGQRRFAEFVASHVERTFVPFKVEMLDGRNLGQALRDSEENFSRYAVVVGREGESKEMVSLKMLIDKEEGRAGKCPTYQVGMKELVDRIIQSERALGFSSAGIPPSGPPPIEADRWGGGGSYGGHPPPVAATPPPMYGNPAPPLPHSYSSQYRGPPPPETNYSYQQPPPYEAAPYGGPPSYAPPGGAYGGPPPPRGGYAPYTSSHSSPYDSRPQGPPSAAPYESHPYEPPRYSAPPPSYRGETSPSYSQHSHTNGSAPSPNNGSSSKPTLSSTQLEGLKNLLSRVKK